MMRVYGVYRNTEPTEGRGVMVLDKLFESESDAEAYRLAQPDYPGHPMWVVRSLDVECVVSDISRQEEIDREGMKQAVTDVRALADKWYNATEATTGNPSIVARAFADEIYRALNGW